MRNDTLPKETRHQLAEIKKMFTEIKDLTGQKQTNDRIDEVLALLDDLQQGFEEMREMFYVVMNEAQKPKKSLWERFNSWLNS